MLGKKLQNNFLKLSNRHKTNRQGYEEETQPTEDRALCLDLDEEMKPGPHLKFKWAPKPTDLA